jgi:hypothetical protein
MIVSLKSEWQDIIESKVVSSESVTVAEIVMHLKTTGECWTLSMKIKQ